VYLAVRPLTLGMEPLTDMHTVTLDKGPDFLRLKIGDLGPVISALELGACGIGPKVIVLQLATYNRRTKTKVIRHIRMQVVTQTTQYFCLIQTKIGMCRQILVRLANIKCHENPVSRSPVTCRQANIQAWLS
jgi:hypothetical protein